MAPLRSRIQALSGDAIEPTLRDSPDAYGALAR